MRAERLELQREMKTDHGGALGTLASRDTASWVLSSPSEDLLGSTAQSQPRPAAVPLPPPSSGPLARRPPQSWPRRHRDKEGTSFGEETGPAWHRSRLRGRLCEPVVSSYVRDRGEDPSGGKGKERSPRPRATCRRSSRAGWEPGGPGWEPGGPGRAEGREAAGQGTPPSSTTAQGL